MLTFQVVLLPRCTEYSPAAIVELRGLSLPTLAWAAPIAATFTRSFEEVAEDLERLPRMFFEPDGSFVWVARQGEPTWQLDGQLADRNGRVVALDLKGVCPAECLDAVLAALGTDRNGVVYQLVREGTHLDDAAFRRYASA